MNNATELVFILDKSGSMSHLCDDTIGGFNTMLKKQKEKEGKCFVSTVLFNDRQDVIHDRKELQDVPFLTSKDYIATGSTALYDAIGNAIHHISNIHKYARKEDIPANTVFIITTDGYENSSRKYSKSDIKKIIEKKQQKDGWEFIFLAANIDACETAETFGIDKSHAVDYIPDSMGTSCLYETVSETIRCVRENKGINANWGDMLKRDFAKRKRK